MDEDGSARQQLVNLLSLRQAHMTFEDAIESFPQDHINTRPPNVEYTFWHLIEHLRRAQWDILDYIVNPGYEAMAWPADYWPEQSAVTDIFGWQQSIDLFLKDRQSLVDIVQDPTTNLYAQIPHGEPGHTIFREICVVAGHNAYHIGELGILRQVMKLW